MAKEKPYTFIQLIGLSFQLFLQVLGKAWPLMLVLFILHYLMMVSPAFPFLAGYAPVSFIFFAAMLWFLVFPSLFIGVRAVVESKSIVFGTAAHFRLKPLLRMIFLFAVLCVFVIFIQYGQHYLGMVLVPIWFYLIAVYLLLFPAVAAYDEPLWPSLKAAFSDAIYNFFRIMGLLIPLSVIIGAIGYLIVLGVTSLANQFFPEIDVPRGMFLSVGYSLSYTLNIASAMLLMVLMHRDRPSR